MIAKASGSKPRCMAIGAKTGTVSRMIEIESIRQPSTNQIATMISKDAPGAEAGAEEELLRGAGDAGHRQHARVELRAEQQQQQRRGGAADVEHHLEISRGLMPLISASISAPAAPTPAPSVGVKTPSQMPPSMPTTSAMTSNGARQHGADRLLVTRPGRFGALVTSAPSGRAAQSRGTPFADERRVQLRHHDDVDDHAANGEKPGDHAGEEELADRLLGEHAPDDHQHRRRDQHAEAGAAGDAAERELAP